MPPLDTQKIKDYFTHSICALTNADRGRLLEDLICYLMESVPGIISTERNKLNAFGTKRFWNRRD